VKASGITIDVFGELRAQVYDITEREVIEAFSH
jgi:hypothetical protein